MLAHQNLSLIPDLTVWQNICLGNEGQRNPFFLDNRGARRNAVRILEELVPGEIPIEAEPQVREMLARYGIENP